MTVEFFNNWYNFRNIITISVAARCKIQQYILHYQCENIVLYLNLKLENLATMIIEIVASIMDLTVEPDFLLNAFCSLSVPKTGILEHGLAGLPQNVRDAALSS